MPRIPIKSFGPRRRPLHPLDLFDNPAKGPDPDPIRTKPRGTAPKALPNERLGEFTVDADPLGKFDPPRPPDEPAIDAVQRLLGLNAKEYPHSPSTRPLPERRPTPVTTMPNEYRRSHDGLPEPNLLKSDNSRFDDNGRIVAPQRKISDVADSIYPSEKESDFDREYTPGEIEKSAVKDFDAVSQEEALSKFGSLSNRFGQDEYIRLLQQIKPVAGRRNFLKEVMRIEDQPLPNQRQGLADDAIRNIQPTRSKEIINILDNALSLSSPDPAPRRTSGVNPASLPKEVLDLDTEIPAAPGGRKSDPKKRIRLRNEEGMKIVHKQQGSGTLRDDIGRPVRMTPWGELSPYWGKDPLPQREVRVNVKDRVEVPGYKTIGEVRSITGGSEQVDVRQNKAQNEGDENRTGGFADDIDMTNRNHLVTTRINSNVPLRGGGARKSKSANEKSANWIDPQLLDKKSKSYNPKLADYLLKKQKTPEIVAANAPKPYLKKEFAQRANMAIVDMPDGTEVQVPLTQVKRVSGPGTTAPDAETAAKALEIQQLLRGRVAGRSTEVDSGGKKHFLDAIDLQRGDTVPIDLPQRAASLPDNLNPFRKDMKPAPNPAASKSAFYQLGRDLPTAGGKYRVRHMMHGKPIAKGGLKKGEWFDMSIDEALEKGIITEKPTHRRPNAQALPEDQKKLQKFANSVPFVKHGTIEGAVGGQVKEPLEVGSIHRITDPEKGHLLVRVTEVIPGADRVNQVKWTPIAQLKGGKWITGALAGATVAGAELLGGEEAEAARVPIKINPQMQATMAPGSAPVKSVPTLSPKLRAMRAIYDTAAPAIEGSRQLEKKGLVVDPENAPHNVYPLNVRGGQAKQDEYNDQLSEIMKTIKDPETLAAFEASTKYKSFQSAIDIAKNKAGISRAEADYQYGLGETQKGDNAIARAMGFETRLKENKIVPNGFTEEQIAKQLVELDAQMSPEQRKIINTAQQGLYKITRRLLTDALQEGLISHAQFQFYAGRGDNYLPLYRLGELFDPATGKLIKKKFLDGGGKGTDSSSRISMLDEDVIDQELMGSDRPTAHPVIGLMQYIEGLTGELQRNKAAKATLTFYDQHSAEIEKMIPENPDMAMYRMKKVGNRRPKEDPPEGFDYVGYMEKGLPVHYLVDKDLATTLTYIDPSIANQGPALTKNIRMLAQMFTASANPAFMTTQVPMDTLSALIKPNYTKYQKTPMILDVPKFLGRLSKEILANFVENITSVDASGLRNKKYAGEIERKMASSSSINTRVDPKIKVLGFKKGAWDQEQGVARKLMRSVIEAGSILQENLLEPIEKGIKNTTYDTLRDRKFNPVEAGAETRAMGGSPDFQRYGTLTQKYKNEILFLNPAMQGLTTMLESQNRNPAQWVKTATIAGLAMGGLAWRNSQYVDNQGRSEMEKVPLEDRKNNLILFHGTPELQSNGDLRQPYLKIPMPHELRALMSPLIAVMNGIQDENYTAGQGVLDVASNFIPIGQSSLDASSPGDLISSVGRRVGASLNPLMRYPMEAFSGKEFFSNLPIVGSRVEGNLPEYQATMKTPPMSVVAGKALGVSPARFDHLLRTVLPGLGEMALEGAGILTNINEDRVTAPVESPSEQMRKAPVSGMLARRWTGALTTNADLSKKKDYFFDYLQKTDQAAKTVSSQKNRNPWELQNLSQDVMIMAEANKYMVEVRNLLSELDRAREIITRHPEISATDKQARLRSFYQAEERLMDNVPVMIQKIKDNTGR